MLVWAMIFSVVALIAAIFGYGGIGAGAAGIGRVLFFGFLALAVLSVAARFVGRGRAE